MFSASGASYEIYVPTVAPLVGSKAALEDQGFTDSDFSTSNTAMGAVFGATMLSMFITALCIADGPKLKRDIGRAVRNIKHGMR